MSPVLIKILILMEISALLAPRKPSGMTQLEIVRLVRAA